MNSQTTPVPSTLLRNKLGKLAIRLQQQAGPQGNNVDFNTREKVLSEAIKILSQFYAKLSEPGYDPADVIVDTVPAVDAFNDNFQAISDDLEVVFSEFENLEGVVLGEFNYMVSRLNRLNRKLKSVSSSLGDFILFSDLPTKDAVFFADSFNNLGRVEANSPLLNAEQCEVNQVEGIVTLPVDRQAQQAINVTETPVINSNSNGRSGNNEELNAQLNGTITDILDNNADTWFEYERVVTTDDGTALRLDFTINMGDERVINFVRVNPNNFGTRTQVQIEAIDTSVDGRDFVSIKDDIPIAGFIAEDEENVFTLAPSTSKFAGQGLYTFTPRKARYVHLTLKQTTPYTITTNAGATKHRYAIGIRDVDIQAVPYKTQGEIISTNYKLTDDVRKVVLLVNQKPDPATVSLLAGIEHSVSPDNGVTWYQIRPRVSVGASNVDQTVPEVLDFNGIDAGSITTTNEVKSLRYRAKLVRNTDNFVSDASELAQNIVAGTELHTPPTTTPLTITLQNSPVDGTLRLIDPQFGSRGKDEAKYQIATGNGSKLRILLPFKPLVRDFQKVLDGSTWTLEDLDPQVVYVNNIPWTRGALTGASNNYELNYEEGRLDFGDGTNGNAVPTGASVSMTLSEERLYPGRGTDHIAKLNYPTSNDKKQVEISLLKPPTTDTFVLKKGAKRHELKPDIIGSYTASSVTIAPSPGTEVEFVDGSSELTGAGLDYSIDYTNGMLYLRVATSTAVDTTVIYRYNPRVVLSEDDWQFTDSASGIADSISMSDNVFQTFRPVDETVPSPVKYFNLSNLAVVRGSVEFFNDTSNVFTTEVEYIDGRSELLGVVHASEQLAAILGVGGAETRVIEFKMKISDDTGFSVTFTDSNTFANLIGAPPGGGDAVGNYYVERDAGGGGRIHVRVDSNVEDPGIVNYYYIDPQASLSGRYSINYQTGEVFCHDATTAGITVRHEYTNYRIKYDIARLVPSEDWEFDSAGKKITINDREILRNLRIPQSVGVASSVGGGKYYQAAYQYVKDTRPDVGDLEPYFSPVLKDYALKIVTRSRLV